MNTKNLIFAAVFLFSLNSNASWYQVFCSNSNGSVKTAMGHNENYTRVNRAYTNKAGEMVSEEVEFHYDEIETDVVSMTEISSNSTSDCDPNRGGGMAEWQNITEQKIVIKRTDGKAFKKGFAGLSQDQMTIEATIRCEENGNSMIFCEPTAMPEPAEPKFY